MVNGFSTFLEGPKRFKVTVPFTLMAAPLLNAGADLNGKVWACSGDRALMELSDGVRVTGNYPERRLNVQTTRFQTQTMVKKGQLYRNSLNKMFTNTSFILS